MKNFFYGIGIIICAWVVLAFVPAIVVAVGALVFTAANPGIGAAMSFGIMATHPMLWSAIVLGIAMLLAFVVFPIWIMVWMWRDAVEFNRIGIKNSPNFWFLIAIVPPIILGIFFSSTAGGPAIYVLANVISSIIAWAFIDLAIVFPTYLIYRNIVWLDQLPRSH